MSLVELLVVLTILALLASTALTSTSQFLEQSRYEATRTTLESCEEAVLGRRGALDPQGHLWTDGFVADIGRLPRARIIALAPSATPEEIEAERRKRLRELWEVDTLDPIAGFGLKPALGDPEVLLLAGWRGPYLNLPLGESGISDSWGRAPLLLRADGTECTHNDAVAQIVSLGADVLPGGFGYDTDMSVVFSSQSFALQPLNAKHLGSVLFRVTPINTTSGGGARVVIRIYGPVDGDAKTLLDSVTDPMNPKPQQKVISAGDPALAGFLSFENVTTGPRVLRVYQTNDDPSATPDAPIATYTHRSPPIFVIVVRGGVQLLDAIEVQ